MFHVPLEIFREPATHPFDCTNSDEEKKGFHAAACRLRSRREMREDITCACWTPHVRQSIGFWIPRCGFLIPVLDPKFLDSTQWSPDSGFHFWISIFWTLYAVDSGFQVLYIKFLVSGTWISESNR